VERQRRFPVIQPEIRSVTIFDLKAPDFSCVIRTRIVSARGNPFSGNSGGNAIFSRLEVIFEAG
jgi:hypothetical protein